MHKLKLNCFFLIFISILALSCSQRDASSPSVAGSDTNYAINVKAGDFAPGQLEAHYLKHGYQFGNITKEEYLENARVFLNTLAGKDILQKTRPNGDILHYRISTGEFAVMAKDGRIRSYFKTDYKYWLKQ